MSIRWSSIAIGAVAFVGAHIVEAAMWQAWFRPEGDFPAWFLNSGRAVAFTALWLFAAGALAVAFSGSTLREASIRGGNAAAGALAAMAVVLGATGPGTLFPIVLFFGALVAAVCCLAGATLAAAIMGWQP